VDNAIDLFEGSMERSIVKGFRPEKTNKENNAEFEEE
jgi:hypothetical protein